jgi:SAM-dependent methyltransferase
MKHKAPHSHGWLVGIFGLAAGLALMVWFPQLEAVGGVLLAVALLHLVGAALVVGSIYSLAPERFHHLLARFRRHAPDDETYDFGWSSAAIHSPWLATAFFWTVALGLQLEFPSLWPAWFAVSLLGVNAFVGGLVLGSSKRADLAALPMVDLLSSDHDLVLDAGCGGGRTTLAISKVLKNGRVVALDRFDAYYISGGGRAHIERNLRIAGLTERVQVEQGDLTEMSFPEAHFDAAVSTHVIDHLKENKRKGLAEIRRVLKPGGRLLMVVWVPGWVTFSLANVFCFLLTSRAGWRKLAGEVGFSVRDEGTFNGMWFAVLERPR